MRIEPSIWRKALSNGLIGGAISLLLGLIGLQVAFVQSYIVTGVFTMGQVFVFAPILLESYSTINKSVSKKPLTLLGVGALTGLVGGAVLAAVVGIAQVVNLREVLINASPALFALWTFNLPIALGVIVLLLIATLTGLVAVGYFMLPNQFKNAIGQASLIVLALGLFRDLIVITINNWGFFKYAFLWLFATSGLGIPGAVVVFLLVGGLVYWRWYRARTATSTSRTPRQQKAIRWGQWAVLALLFLLLPLILGSALTDNIDTVGIYILMGLGLNIVVGFAGLLDLGYVAFFAIGAYSLGVFTTSEAVGLLHLSFWVAVPIALVIAVFAGIVLGLPVLRLRGDYLAIVTLGFGEIIRILVLSDWFKPHLGGPEGVQHIGQPTIGPLVLGNQQQLYYVILAGVLITGFIATRLKDSHLGRSWMALREDEDVAEAMGINKVVTKLMAFGMGALFSGLGGALFATKIGSTYPQSFSFIVSINILSLIIIGGIGSIPGVFVGGLALVGLPLFLSQFADFVYLIYGASLVFMMLRRPEGLLPEARRRLELHEETTEKASEEPPTILKTPGR